MAHLTRNRWLGVVILTITGFLLLWWADQQVEDLLFKMPLEPRASWTTAGWLSTQIAAGVAFGLAAGYAGVSSARANRGALAAIGVIPAAIVVYYFGALGPRWFPMTINQVTTFLFAQRTITLSAVAVGLVLVAIAAGVTGND